MADFNRMLLGTNPFWHSADLNLAFKVNPISSTEHRLYWFFSPPAPVVITHLGFRYDIRVGTPPLYQLSLRQIDDSGSPKPGDQILTSRTFQPPADASWNGLWQWIEMLTPYAASRNERLCGVLQHFQGSVTASHHSRFTQSIQNAGSVRGYFPYTTYYNGLETRDKSQPVFGWRSPTKAYGWPYESLLLQNVNNPTQTGIRFLLNKRYANIFTLKGARFQGKMAGANGKSFAMILYDTDNNEQSRVVWDADISVGPSTQDATAKILFDDATLPSLMFGKEYFLVFEPQEADTNFALRTIAMDEAFDLDAVPGGASAYAVERSGDTGPWTNFRNRRPQIDLLPGEWSI